jgi:hypothetical protein
MNTQLINVVLVWGMKEISSKSIFMAGFGVGAFIVGICFFGGVVGIWTFKRLAIRKGINLESDEDSET